jgi:hypothetical protein
MPFAMKVVNNGTKVALIRLNTSWLPKVERHRWFIRLGHARWDAARRAAKTGLDVNALFGAIGKWRRGCHAASFFPLRFIETSCPH